MKGGLMSNNLVFRSSQRNGFGPGDIVLAFIMGVAFGLATFFANTLYYVIPLWAYMTIYGVVATSLILWAWDFLQEINRQIMLRQRGQKKESPQLSDPLST
jgi:hypothetical protein